MSSAALTPINPTPSPQDATNPDIQVTGAPPAPEPAPGPRSGKTVWMLSPSGTKFQASVENIHAALADGGHLLMPMVSPTGTKTLVRLDQVHDAIRDGGQIDDPAVNALSNNSGMTGIGSGFAKGAIDSMRGVSNIVGDVTGTKNPLNIPDVNTAPTSGYETAGKYGEGLLEFMMGDEALKGLSLGEKLSKVTPVVRAIESHPRLASIVAGGLKGATVGGVEGGVKGAATDQGAQGAAIGAATGGVAGIIGPVVSAAKEAASVLSPSADVTDQITKDAIKTVLGSKTTSDVADSAAAYIDKPKIFSTVENELKLVKPKVDANLADMNQKLDDVLSSANVKVPGAADAVNATLDNLIAQAKAGVGDSSEAQAAIDTVRQRILPKLTPATGRATAIDAEYLNDLKRLVGDQVKKFAPPDLLNSSQKSEQEAYRQVYFTLRDLVSKAVPESADLNQRISQAFNLQDLLEKKFPQLATPEQAQASYAGARSTAAKKAVGKVALGAAGLGTAEELIRHGLNAVR